MSLPLTTETDPTTVTPDTATCNSTTCSDPTFIFSDHLGSTSITTDVEGNLVSETRYDPWGEVRHVSGLTLTDYTFTGQYSYMDNPTTAASEGFGLMFYNARWYDPGLGRFAQADTIVPLQSQGTQAWDRYAYVNNNPVRYDDPSGHCAVVCTAFLGAATSAGFNYGMQVYGNLQKGASFRDAMTQNIDGKAIFIAAVGGAVAGATMGAVNPLLLSAVGSSLGGSVGAAAISGALANVAGGQAEALATAGVDQAGDVMSGEAFNGEEFMQTAENSGFMQGDVMAFDAVVGGATAGLTQGVLNHYVGVPLHPGIIDSPSREALRQASGYLTGLEASVARGISNVAKETVIRLLRRTADPYILQPD